MDFNIRRGKRHSKPNIGPCVGINYKEVGVGCGGVGVGDGGPGWVGGGSNFDWNKQSNAGVRNE